MMNDDDEMRCTRAIHSLKSNMSMADMSSPEVINKLELLHPPNHDQLPKLPCVIEQSLIRQLDACMDVTAERRCILA